jgi:tetratricopeptide (TPR) repeat protein
MVAITALAVHGPSIGFGWTNLDDRDLVVDDQPFLTGVGGVIHAFARSYMHVVDQAHAYYRPLVTASFAVDAAWSGARPFGYHLTNVAWFAAACVLLFALLRRLGFGLGASAVASLAFAVNPALVPAVAWVPGRNDVMLAVFALAAWILLLRDAERPSPLVRVAHLASFGLALATKETALVLPFVFAAQLVLLDGPAAAIRRRPATLATLGAGWAVLVGVRLGLQAALHLDPLSGGAAADVFRAAPLVAATFAEIATPVDPSLIGVSADAPVARGVLVAAAVALAAFRLPGVRRRIVVLGAVAAAFSALPSAALAGTVVLGHRLVLPACGATIVLAELGRASIRDRAAGVAFAVAGIAALAALAVGYEATFRDRRRFARAAVEAAPHSPLAHFCLGQSHQIDGDDRLALAEYAIALELGPLDVVHNNIAVIHMASGRWNEAERELRAEIAQNPRYARAYENLGIVLRHEDRAADADEATARARALAGTAPKAE